jgi:hypothetical protein
MGCQSSPPACGLRRNPTVVIFIERLTSELRYRSPLYTCGQFLDKRSYGVTIMTREPVELRSCCGAQKELDTRFLTIVAKVALTVGALFFCVSECHAFRLLLRLMVTV